MARGWVTVAGGLACRRPVAKAGQPIGSVPDHCDSAERWAQAISWHYCVVGIAFRFCRCVCEEFLKQMLLPGMSLQQPGHVAAESDSIGSIRVPSSMLDLGRGAPVASHG